MALLTADDVLLFLPDEEISQVEQVVTGLCSRVRIEIPAVKDEGSLDEDQKAAIKDILRRAAVRTLESGSGVKVTEAAPGGWSETIVAPDRKGLLYDSEWDELRRIANGSPEVAASQAFAFASGSYGAIHEPDCSSLAGSYPCDCFVRFPPVEIHPLRMW